MKILKWLDDNLEEYILAILSVVMSVTIFLQVIMRYIVNNSLIWSEEVAIYCFIWMIFIGASYAVKKNTHIKIDAILQLFGDRGKNVFHLISQIIFLVFAIVLMLKGYQLAEQLMEWKQKSPALRFPMWFVYMATPVGMLLVIIRLLQNIYLNLKANSPKGSSLKS